MLAGELDAHGAFGMQDAPFDGPKKQDELRKDHMDSTPCYEFQTI